MWQAMLSGVASLKAHQTKMNVIGNNIANINTTGFKASRAQFQDLMFQTYKSATRPNDVQGGTNPVQVGLGTQVGSIDTLMTQGNLELTGRETDLAIQGNGFFVVSDGDEIRYTRDGAFELDSAGYLVHRATGKRVMGWVADSTGKVNVSEALAPNSLLQLPVTDLTAVRPTSRVTYVGNLNATADTTDTWTSRVKVYDGLGVAHDVTLTLSNRQAPPTGTPPADAVASWDWSASEGSTVVGDSSTTGNTSLYFDNAGTLVGSGTQIITITPTNGAAPLTIQLDFSSLTQLADETLVQPTEQDGFPPGSLQQFQIGRDGLVTGIFSNGFSRTLGQLALATFSNPGGLHRVGDNLWRVSNNSGLPVIGTPARNGYGELNAGYLESSNVDLGGEFAEMIVAQRGFQANTRIVTVVDELLAEVVNIKR